jgi:hypothetical protein
MFFFVIAQNKIPLSYNFVNLVDVIHNNIIKLYCKLSLQKNNLKIFKKEI